MNKLSFHLLHIVFILILFPVLSIDAQNLALDSNLGYKNAQTIAAEMILYEDVEKTAYISRVGNRLVASLEKPLFDYQFHIIADPTPNAFALPGGYIYITTGLILLLQNEDELACILGHEIIHSNNRHAIKQIRCWLGFLRRCCRFTSSMSRHSPLLCLDL